MKITTISLQLPLKIGSVNCYLVESAESYILIDTGISMKRAGLERELIKAGCRPGNLKLIVITHGDFDHTGNAAYLRQKFKAPIAMHEADTGMAESGDMSFNRNKTGMLVRWLVPILAGFGRSERFAPDIFIDDGFDLSESGFDAKILGVPGHSLGSVAVLTSNGDLFCGDLLINQRQPSLNSLIDDRAAAAASLAKLKEFKINTVYPGHGRPFAIDKLFV